MKKILNSIMLVMIGIIAMASCSSSKTAAEKALETMQDSVAGIHALDALKDGHFVVLAERVMFSPGGRMYTSPREETNFVYVLGDEGVAQFAFENGRLGMNGLGGVTCKGRVSNKVITTEKNGNTRMRYSLTGNGTSATVDIVLYKNSNSAQANVSGNFGGGSMTIYGKLEAYDGK